MLNNILGGVCALSILNNSVHWALIFGSTEILYAVSAHLHLTVSVS